MAIDQGGDTRRMKDTIKGFLTPEQEAYDRERFLEALLCVREKLSDLERECSENEVLRDTVTICCEAIYRQLYALAVVCCHRQ
ncbi:MAG: hypothetical protein ACR2GR_10255 [Rhodothermales bacterium]